MLRKLYICCYKLINESNFVENLRIQCTSISFLKWKSECLVHFSLLELCLYTSVSIYNIFINWKYIHSFSIYNNIAIVSTHKIWLRYNILYFEVVDQILILFCFQDHDITKIFLCNAFAIKKCSIGAFGIICYCLLNVSVTFFM